jgi:hypothetical protein
MICRCTDPNNNRFRLYGGRGIRVCARWLGEHGFESFLADVGERPEPKREYSLDRWPNKNGNYELGNCRWATRSQQMKNRRPFARKQSKPGPVQLPSVPKRASA